MSMIGIGDVFKGAVTTMNDYVGEIQDTVVKIFDNLADLINKETYKPLHESVKRLEAAYNEEVLGKIKHEINEWVDGEGSFVSCVKLYSMGDEAESEAQRQQGEIVDAIKEINYIKSISDINPNFYNTKFNIEEIKGKLTEISDNTKKLNEIASNKKSELEKLAEENEIVKSIEGVGEVYGNSIAAFVGKAIQSMEHILSEKFEEANRATEKAINIDKDKAKAFNEAIDANMDSLTSFFDSLF